MTGRWQEGEGVKLALDDFQPRILRALHHVGRSRPCARKSNNNVRLGMVEHPLIYDRSSALAVEIPIRLNGENRQSLPFCPCAADPVRAPRAAFDYARNAAPLNVRDDAHKVALIGKVPASANENAKHANR